MPRQPRSFRAEGIVLKHKDYGEADRMLTVYTRRRGKVRALAKGVRKVRSRIDERVCINCGRCHITCRDGGHLAIGFAADRRPVVDDAKCVGCGMCAAVCPVSGCIRMVAV